MADEVLTDSIEHDDRVMNREADHGQDGDDEDRIELNAEESAEDRERTEYEERVVHERDHSRAAKAPRIGDLAERPPEIGEDRQAGRSDGEDGLVDDLIRNQRGNQVQG